VVAHHRQETDAVDWIKTDANSRWLATNLGHVDVWGADSSVTHVYSKQLSISLRYAYLHKTAEPEPYASRYALDYPRHTVGVDVCWTPHPLVEVRAAQSLRCQVDNPVRSSSDVGVDGRLQLRLVWPRLAGTAFTLAVDNLWDSDLQPLPGQTPPGRRVSLAVNYVW
jgi:outer membrane receptor for ferrienterochelin and colicin